MSKSNLVSPPAACLVGIQLPEQSTDDFLASLEELKRLVETLGLEVTTTVTQKRKSPSAATAVGEGKLEEISRLAKDGVEIIFDMALTPSQLRNLETATGSRVRDRTGVIIEIFHRHAKTREARLQVELARLRYMAPRLRLSVHGERQSLGKGAGESALELDKRRLRDRIAELNRELSSISQSAGERRHRRRDQSRVALVGYTNAGKSSLMRALTGSQILVADKLFATLDTTVRILQPESYPRILVSDTVGFIKDLPHDLVASFRSTLEEALEAGLLLLVVDASDPSFHAQLEVTRGVLAEIGAADLPTLLLLNKRDRLPASVAAELQHEFPEAILMSSLNPEDITQLRQRILDLFQKDLLEANLLLPYDAYGVIGEIRSNAHVLAEKYEPDGLSLRVRATPASLKAWQRFSRPAGRPGATSTPVSRKPRTV